MRPCGRFNSEQVQRSQAQHGGHGLNIQNADHHRDRTPDTGHGHGHGHGHAGKAVSGKNFGNGRVGVDQHSKKATAKKPL